MKMLVVGGSQGIGKEIKSYYQAESISRTENYTFPDNTKEIIDACSTYDIIINCIHGSNQLNLSKTLFEALENKTIISIGSLSYIFEPENPKRELNDWNKELIFNNSSVKHVIINLSWCFNCRDEAKLTKIKREDIFSAIDFITKMHYSTSSIMQIDIKGKVLDV